VVNIIEVGTQNIKQLINEAKSRCITNSQHNVLAMLAESLADTYNSSARQELLLEHVEEWGAEELDDAMEALHRLMQWVPVSDEDD
jgi:hypothetical protein